MLFHEGDSDPGKLSADTLTVISPAKRTSKLHDNAMQHMQPGRGHTPSSVACRQPRIIGFAYMCMQTYRQACDSHAALPSCNCIETCNTTCEGSWRTGKPRLASNKANLPPPALSIISDATEASSDENVISTSGYRLMFMARTSAILLGFDSSDSI